jgi:hypothetical protein
LILNGFYKQLVNSGMFPMHRTWHEFEFIGGVRVKGWSTKTEEVKFEDIQSAGDELPEGLEIQDGRVDVKLAPAPPDMHRESLPTLICPKCGKVSKSKPGAISHLRFCKAEVKIVYGSEIGKDGGEVLTATLE